MLSADQIIGKLKLKDDVKYVRHELSRFNYYQHDAIMNEYMDQWRQGVNDEPIEHRKQNKGRVRANNWLREYKY